MFKKKYTCFGQIICFVFFLTIMLTGCDGRYRTFEKPSYKNSVTTLDYKNSNIINIIPEAHIVSETDTLVNPNLKVSIKYFSMENRVVSVINKKGQEEHYREFTSEISIYNHGQLRVKNMISKDDFQNIDDTNFWKSAVLQYVWLDEFETTKDKISINCSFLVPNTKTYKTYKIYFNHEGERDIKLIATS